MGRQVGEKFKRIVELAQSGLHPVAIAQRVKSTPAAIAVALSRARKHGIDVHGPNGRPRMTTIFLSESHRAQLDVVAEERGMTRSELASRVVEAVVDGDLFTAVLDR